MANSLDKSLTKLDKPFTKWCTQGGGYISILLVALGVLILVALTAAGVKIAMFVADQTGIRSDTQALRIAFSLVCLLLSLMLLEAPIFTYVTNGQAKRIQLIKGYFSAAVIVRYLDQFWSGRDGFGELVDEWKKAGRQVTPPLSDKLHSKFDELLQDDFGLKAYIFPAIVLTATAVIVLFFGFYGGLALALDPLGAAKGVVNYPLGIKIDLVSVAAIFGAYTWITSDAITRNYQSALHPSDLYWYALRFVVAIPLGEAISMITISKEASGAGLVNAGSAGAVLAFVISMFSFDRISQILSAVANKSVGAPAGTPAERDDLVIKLPGVDEATSNRLTAEGITTIAQMGAADPIRVSIRASIAFDFALGLIDAALLWNYVGSKLDCLRNCGFKGVTSILNYHDYALSKDAPDDRALDDYRGASLAFSGGQKAVSDAAANVERCRATFLSCLTKKDNAENARIGGEEAKNVAASAARVQPNNPDYANLQAAVQVADKALVDMTTEAETAKAELASAISTLGSASAALTTAQNDLETLTKSLSGARAALMGPGTLLSDAADKAGIKELGLRNIIEQVVRNEYAAFIRRMMWELPQQ